MKILVICIGNICRSSAMSLLLRNKIKEHGMRDEIQVDSCGVEDFHLGQEMNVRMRRTAEKRGYKLGKHKARQLRKSDLDKYDYLLVVTHDLIDEIADMATPKQQKKLFLATHFSKTHKGEEIPDPYYGDMVLFNDVFEMIETVVEETFVALKKKVK